MLRHRRHPIFPRRRAPPSGPAPASRQNAAPSPSRTPAEIHHLAADQVGPVEILRRRAAAIRCAARPPARPATPAPASRSSTPTSFDRQLPAAAAAGLDPVGPPDAARHAAAGLDVAASARADPCSERSLTQPRTPNGAPTTPSSMSADDSPLIAAHASSLKALRRPVCGTRSAET